MLRNALTVLCIALVLHPTVVRAGPAEDSLAVARHGAEHFKAQRYYEAAVEFEKAYALDPQDLKNLRYAGRAWQEVGYWERALVLLERYFALEPDPALKQSILEKLEPLRQATPLQKAEALDKATQRFPQAHLEEEAAQAFERLGDEASLRRAVTLLELARLGASAVADKERLDGDLRRVRERLERPAVAKEPLLAKEPLPAKEPPPAKEPVVVAQVPPVQKAEPGEAPRPGRLLRTVLFASGGVLVGGGGAVLWLGRTEGIVANQNAADRTYRTYEAYQSDKSRADLHWTLGAVTLGVGAALAIAGLLVPRQDAPKSVTLLPNVSTQGVGLAAVGRF